MSFRSLALFVTSLTTACLLSACGDGAAPNPPVKELSALVVEEANGPVLDALQNQVELVPYDGSQKVTDHDLLILDGDSQSPTALASSKVLDQAFAAGVWVMVVDASYEHKKQGLAPRLGLTTQGTTDAYLFRQVVAAAMPTYEVLELPSKPAADAKMQTLQASGVQAHQRQRFAERAVKKLKGSSCGTPLDLPQGGIYATWCYGAPVDYSLTSASWYENVYKPINAGDVFTVKGQDYTVQPQKGSQVSNFVLTLLLNNKDTPQGDYQTLHVQLDGQMTPTETTWPDDFPIEELRGQPYLIGDWSPQVNFLAELVAWPQSDLYVVVGPDASQANVWEPAGNYSPQTPNNVTQETYTSTTSFTWNFSPKASATGGGAGGISQTVSNSSSKSYSVPDWTWTADNDQNPQTYAWHFYSNNPLGGDWDQWTTLNELNEHLMRFGTAAVWTTCPDSQCQLHTDTLSFDLHTNQQVINLECVISEGCPLVAAEEQGFSQTVELDMNTVVPVTVSSLSFTDVGGQPVGSEDNPVSAGDPVTATVALTGEAQFGYDVGSKATSLNDNAFITTDPVAVNEGEESFSFTIETNGNNLSSGQSVAAGIQVASFGTTLTEQLFIQQP